MFLEEHTMKHAIITGGSQGLGFALGAALAQQAIQRQQEVHLTLVARNSARLEEAARTLRRENVHVLGIVADVADKNAIHRLAGHSQAEGGPADLFIHNASSLGPTHPTRSMPHLADLDCEDFQQVLETNLLGPLRLTKALVGQMALHGGGTFLFISSDAAVSAYAGWGAYGVSKAALDHLMRSFAAEFPSVLLRVRKLLQSGS
jgi:NAD(P)-dependent dehydrogenase (short-subunit alcohol dehydrogenase family)